MDQVGEKTVRLKDLMKMIPEDQMFVMTIINGRGAVAYQVMGNHIADIGATLAECAVDGVTAEGDHLIIMLKDE